MNTSHPGRNSPGDESGTAVLEPAHTAPVHANPYLDAGRAAEAPDLEAHAPVLRSSEAQRLNRKALVFLAGIVGLLLLMAFWMFSKATGRGPRAEPARGAEVVRIPELPRAAAAPEAVAPIEVRRDPEPVAMSELPPLPAASPAPAAHAAPGYPAPPVPPPPPSLMERRMGVEAAAAPGSPRDAYAQAVLASLQPATPGQAPAAAAPRASARYLANPDALLIRGTYIRCVLQGRIVTDVPGYTACVVTEPVYSVNGRRLLLPKGSKVSGTYQGAPVGERVAVVWDRITTPNGIDVNMASPGVDGLGGAGHPGQRDAHWGARISSALLLSLLSDGFKYAAAKNGPTTTIATGTTVLELPFESNTAQTVQHLAQQAARDAASRPPTVTINQGTVVNVYVAKDIDFSDVVAPAEP